MQEELVEYIAARARASGVDSESLFRATTDAIRRFVAHSHDVSLLVVDVVVNRKTGRVSCNHSIDLTRDGKELSSAVSRAVDKVVNRESTPGLEDAIDPDLWDEEGEHALALVGPGEQEKHTGRTGTTTQVLVDGEELARGIRDELARALKPLKQLNRRVAQAITGLSPHEDR